MLEQFIKEHKEELGIKLYNYGRMSDKEELSNEQEVIEELVESNYKVLLAKVVEMVEKRQKQIQDLVDRFGYEEDKARLEEIGMLLTSLQGECSTCKENDEHFKVQDYDGITLKGE